MKEKELKAQYVTIGYDLQVDTGYGSSKRNYAFCKIANVSREDGADGSPLVAVTVLHDNQDLVCVYRPDDVLVVRPSFQPL